MTKQTTRDLLTSIGMGQHNATLAIPYMMIAPAVLDPKTPMVINMVRFVQQQLYQMGASDVTNTGYLDSPTAAALLQVVGPNWERASWAHNIQALIGARDRGMSLSRPQVADTSMPVAVGGPLDFLPDVPGGLVTYGIIGYLVYRYLAKPRSAR